MEPILAHGGSGGPLADLAPLFFPLLFLTLLLYFYKKTSGQRR